VVVKRWLRGPQLPIAIVLVIAMVSYGTYRRGARLKWPFAGWTMYASKGQTESFVSYRRFVAYRDDGTRIEVSLGEAFGFLDRPYRLDRGLDRNQAGFLIECLIAMRKNLGAHIVGLAHERRTWNYETTSYEEHLAAPADDSFRIAVAEAPPEELLRMLPAQRSLVSNGGFLKLRMKSGRPRDWEILGRSSGIGVDLRNSDRSLLLGAGPAPASASQIVDVPAGTQEVRLSALIRTSAPGVSIELITTLPGSAPLVTRADAPADDVWHEVAVTQPFREGAEVRVVLRSQGAADAFYDYVALYPTGG